MFVRKLLLVLCISLLLLHSVVAGKMPDQYRGESKDADEHSKQSKFNIRSSGSMNF